MPLILNARPAEADRNGNFATYIEPTVLGRALNYGGYNYGGDLVSLTDGNENWMTSFPDSQCIGEPPIPGTHDTMSSCADTYTSSIIPWRIGGQESFEAIQTADIDGDGQAVLLAPVSGYAQSLNPSTARLCNGLPYLCEKRFDEVTFPGNHNSGSGADGLLYHFCDPNSPASSCFYRNQGSTITGQLAFGIRYFDIDTCICNGVLVTCHGAAYGPPILNMFAEFDAFLNLPENRNEVIILTFGDQDGDVQGLLYAQLLRWEATPERIANRELTIYKPLPGDPPDTWPTLGSLVPSNRRIVVFVRNPSLALTQIGAISEKDAIYDTWISRECTWSCYGVVNDTFDKCYYAAQNHPEKLVLVSVFCSQGLCLSDLAGLCDDYLLRSLISCRGALGSVRVPNFITADWTQNRLNNQNIVEAVRFFNLNHLKESYALPISSGTASHIGFESGFNGRMISAGVSFHTQWFSDKEQWKWVKQEGSPDVLEYGQEICLQSKDPGQYLSNMGGNLQEVGYCDAWEHWRIEKYSPENDHPVETVGQVQAGDEICLYSMYDGRYIRAYDDSLGLEVHCQAHEKFLLQAGWNDSDEDLVIDEGDNCPETPNSDQSDMDNDGTGDACDAYPLGTFGTWLPVILGR